MQLDNNINTFKEELFKNGYLNIHMGEIYPDIFNKFTEVYKYDDSIKYEALRVDLKLSGIHSKESILNLFDSDSDYIDMETSMFNFHVEEEFNFTNINAQIRLKRNFDNSFEILNKFKNILSSVTINQVQQWIEMSSTDHTSKNGQIFDEITNKILKDFYNITSNNNPLTVTCFQKGDKIESHQDSVEARYVCVILVYLSKDYEDGFGGELFIENTELVKPEFGRIAILDFTNHNVIHEVKEVIGDYKRIALLNFISK